MKGKFYVFEGIDGSGKTTVINELKKLVDPDKFLFTKEPYSQRFIDLLKTTASPTERAYIFALDRAIHIQEVIQPALDSGVNVICDRFVMSNVVYQTYEYMALTTSSLTRENCKDFMMFIEDIQPDTPYIERTFILDIDPLLAAQRCREKEEMENIHKLIELWYLYNEYINTGTSISYAAHYQVEGYLNAEDIAKDIHDIIGSTCY